MFTPKELTKKQELIESIRDDIQDYEKSLDDAEKEKIGHDKWIEKLKDNLAERKETLAGLLGEDKCSYDETI